MSSLMMIFMQTPGILERQIFRPGAGNAPAAATCILNTCIVSSIIEHAYIYICICFRQICMLVLLPFCQVLIMILICRRCNA